MERAISFEDEVKNRDIKIDSLKVEQTEMEKKVSELKKWAEKAHASDIKDLLASLEYARLATMSYFEGFEDMRRQCMNKFPNIENEMDDETTSVVNGGGDD